MRRGSGSHGETAPAEEVFPSGSLALSLFPADANIERLGDGHVNGFFSVRSAEPPKPPQTILSRSFAR